MTAPRDSEPQAEHDFARPFTEIWGEAIERNDRKPLPDTGKWKPSEHTRAVASIVEALRKLPGWTRVRKRPVGRFLLADLEGRPKKKPGGGYVAIKVASKGDPDVECLWTPPGETRPWVLMVEAKTGSGRLTEEQDEKRRHLLKGGCIHIVASNGEEAARLARVATKFGVA